MTLLYTLGEAAKATGKTKAAIWQAIAANRLPAAKDGRNRWQIEPSELFKLYPPLRQARCEELNGALPPDAAVLQARVELLERLCHQLEQERDYLRKQGDELLDSNRRIMGLLGAEKALQLESFQQKAPTVIQVPPAPEPAPAKASQPLDWWRLFFPFFGRH